MTPLGGSVLGKFFAENIALFQLIYGANSDLSVSNLAPISDNSAGHMLKIIVPKKDAFWLMVETHRTLRPCPRCFLYRAPVNSFRNPKYENE